ncbi:MAG: nucleotidyltransferase domain-containing protein [Oscillospiraceae bacterium]|nr:nucleotidyltransferase domain-containing protein [Oscillospiraceae bacterium]
MLDKSKVREIAVQYADTVRKTLNPKSVILFGSYANGTPHEHSDIDIAIVFNNYNGDWLGTASELVGLAWEVNSYIEPHMLDERCDSSGFLEHIKENGEVIYNQIS